MDIVSATETRSVDHIIDYIRAHARCSVEHGYRGSENMRLDELNVELVQAAVDDTVYVRMYSWDPWCVSLGAHQKESDIDAERMHRKGFDCVRRVTGGRAVLHAEELTYSIVMRLSDDRMLHDVYRASHSMIQKALYSLGAVAVVFERSQPNFAQRYKLHSDSVSCFTSSARSEIMFEGRKVVGSAQRVYADVVLQHGSILLGPAHEQLADVVVAAEDERGALRESIRRSSACLSEICGSAISFDECAQALMLQFSQ